MKIASVRLIIQKNSQFYLLAASLAASYSHQRQYFLYLFVSNLHYISVRPYDCSLYGTHSKEKFYNIVLFCNNFIGSGAWMTFKLSAKFYICYGWSDCMQYNWMMNIMHIKLHFCSTAHLVLGQTCQQRTTWAINDQLRFDRNRFIADEWLDVNDFVYTYNLRK